MLLEHGERGEIRDIVCVRAMHERGLLRLLLWLVLCERWPSKVLVACEVAVVRRIR